MKKKGSFFGWLRSNSTRTIAEIADDEDNPKYTKRCFHRGFYVENKTGDHDNWKAQVNGNFITGELETIKECIDWWVDMKKFLPLKVFKSHKPESRNIQTVSYRGFNLINDKPEYDNWYMLHKEKLYKGSLEKLKEMIDRAHDMKAIRQAVE